MVLTNWYGDALMKSRRRVNSAVMQLILTNRKVALTASALLVGSFLFGGCRKAPTDSSAIRVSVCELYENPTVYDGKLIRVNATVTGLPDGTYVYPGPTSNECRYSFIKLDADQIQNSALGELKPLTRSFPERKEFDLELTATFDSKYLEDSRYTEPWDQFRYRIVAVEIKCQSPVRIGKRLGAA